MQIILIIEDNKSHIKFVEDFLASIGFTILTAQSAEEGLALLRQIRPVLILLDLRLPGIDGFTAVTTLKQDPELSSIPVVAVTAYAMPGDKERALDAGCNDYISKPIDLRELCDCIRRLLRSGSEPE